MAPLDLSRRLLIISIKLSTGLKDSWEFSRIMNGLSLITTFRRSQLSTWFSDLEEIMQVFIKTWIGRLFLLKLSNQTPLITRRPRFKIGKELYMQQEGLQVLWSILEMMWQKPKSMFPTSTFVLETWTLVYFTNQRLVKYSFLRSYFCDLRILLVFDWWNKPKFMFPTQKLMSGTWTLVSVTSSPESTTIPAVLLVAYRAPCRFWILVFVLSKESDCLTSGEIVFQSRSW